MAHFAQVKNGIVQQDIVVINDDDDLSPARLHRVTFLGLMAASPPPSDDDDDHAPSSSSSSSLDARALSEFLMEIGASSVSVTDSDGGTPSEDPIFGSARDMLDDDDYHLSSTYAMVLPDYAVGRNLWRKCDVSANFPYSFDVSYVVDAVRDAFDSAKRQLEETARELRGDVKTHAPELRGKVARLRLDEGYGFIETGDGRELYFSRDNVVHPSFEQLEPGTVVQFIEELAAEGPQAKRVSAGRHPA
jgi:cold shock CspA family protein